METKAEKLNKLLDELIDTQKDINFVWGKPLEVERAVFEQNVKKLEIMHFFTKETKEK